MFQIILNLKMQKIQIIHMIKYESKIIKLCNEKKKNKNIILIKIFNIEYLILFVNS